MCSVVAGMVALLQSLFWRQRQGCEGSGCAASLSRSPEDCIRNSLWNGSGLFRQDKAAWEFYSTQKS